MSSDTRRQLLRALAGGSVAVLAGCFGSEDDPDDDSNADDSKGDPAADDEESEPDTNESNGDESTDVEDLEIPDPVDWSDESRATIEVGPGEETSFEPDAVRVTPGTTLRWLWQSDGHTVTPTHQPEGGAFDGIESVEHAGFEVEFAPETTGEYRYVCDSHEEEMVGYLVVEE